MPIIYLSPYQGSSSVTITDPYFSNVAALLHFDGTNGSTTMTDSSSIGRTFTPASGVTITTAASKFGGACASFNGTTSATITAASSADFAVGTGDFTVEGWAYFKAYTGTATGCFQLGASGNGIGTTVNSIAVGLVGSAGAWQIYANNTNTNTSGIATPLNTWTHWAIVRSSGVTKLYVNGVLGVTVTDTTNYTCTNLTLGAINSTIYNLNGYQDEFRFTKGIARYTSAFTPPTAVFPNIGGDPNFNSVTSLLPFDGSVSDVKGTTITNSGVTISTTSKKMGSGSGRFDGASQMQLAASSAFNFGTSPFTIEFWLNPDIAGAAGSAFPLFSYDNKTLIIQIQGTNSPICYINSTSSGWAGAAGVCTAGVWTHLAVVRNAAGLCTMYVNGVATGTTVTHTEAIGSSTLAPRLGYEISQNKYFTGYIDDFRITNGVARYTANFTPPVGPLPITS